MSRLPIWVNDNMQLLLIQLTAELITTQQQGSIHIYKTDVNLQDNNDQ